MLPTHVHPWKGTFHGRGTGGPGLSRSHPPSSAEQAARPETSTGTNDTSSEISTNTELLRY